MLSLIDVQNKQSCSIIPWIHFPKPIYTDMYVFHTKECFIKILFLSLFFFSRYHEIWQLFHHYLNAGKKICTLLLKSLNLSFLVLKKTRCNFVVVIKLTLCFKKSQAVVVFVLFPLQCPFGISNGSAWLDVLRQFGRSSLFCRLRLIISSSFWLL